MTEINVLPLVVVPAVHLFYVSERLVTFS